MNTLEKTKKFIGGGCCGNASIKMSCCAAAEVGWRLSFGGVTLALGPGPNWSNVEFDNLFDPTLARVSLQDGDTPTMVLGISAGGEWSSGEAQGSFRASADMHLPFYGEYSPGVAGGRAPLRTGCGSPYLIRVRTRPGSGATGIPSTGRSAGRRSARPRSTVQALASGSVSDYVSSWEQ